MNLPGGELEDAVLEALWELGEASVRELHEHVGEPRGLVYTTTAKVVDRLREKGLVRRKASAKGFSYRASITRAVVIKARARAAVASVLGEPRPAAAALLDAVGATDRKLLAELERLVMERRGKK
jgi:BlaI family transcriptional regulator, penicillinase repressor